MSAPDCPYCGERSELVDGTVIYPHRRDLASKSFYRCAPCDAYVGCHPGTITPLGRLANAELRRAKQNAHAAFDRLWKSKMRQHGCTKGTARRSAYKWLAKELGIDFDDCHIGMFDVATCERVVRICQPFHREARRD